MKYNPDGTVCYQCEDCGAVGVKLWRDYQSFLDHQTLRCGPCALKSQGRDGPIDAEGRRSELISPDDKHPIRTDSIGWCVPAVPTPHRDTFWGYSSVPQDAADWWRALPLEPVPAQEGER